MAGREQLGRYLSLDSGAKEEKEVSYGRSQWPRGLRRESAAARLLELRVRISQGAWLSLRILCTVR
jgi:hypothetical protein